MGLLFQESLECCPISSFPQEERHLLWQVPFPKVLFLGNPPSCRGRESILNWSKLLVHLEMQKVGDNIQIIQHDTQNLHGITA